MLVLGARCRLGLVLGVGTGVRWRWREMICRPEVVVVVKSGYSGDVLNRLDVVAVAVVVKSGYC
jgi:hypothetical protein